MKLDFRKPTKQDEIKISTWKYDGEYSFYDNDKTEAKSEWAKNIDQEDNTFAIYCEDELIGNCSFDYDEGKYILGLQMKPDLTGKEFGTDFLSQVLVFGRNTFYYDYIKLVVAKFNKRAI